ncbi:hypothetical protein CQW23_24254 [Capsicum baccatum]|uniref:Uncharacterized protein n=1 Tax=Capsicum baccatum TaxID=33114 RepID=A0A2G2VUA9_CAPBA|nr:hypothetical protein CQW23_24254 [Capsicum baccatum]
MGLTSEQNDGWKVYARKPKNKGGKSTGKECSSCSKNAWDWSARAFSAHPKKTPPVADDNKVGEHDTGDNEMDFIDESDDDLQYDDFDSNVTETSYEFCKKDRRSC